MPTGTILRCGACLGSGREIDFAPIENKAQLQNPGAALPARLAAWRVKDRPFIVTEWNDCFPNDRRLEGPVIMAAYGSLQGWDGMLQFDYGPHQPMGFRRKMTSFGIHTRPDNEPLFQAAALIYRGAYVHPGAEEVIEPIDDGAALGPGSSSDFLTRHPWLPYAVRVSKRFTGKEKGTQPSLDGLAALHDEIKKTIRSSDHELELRYGSGVLRIDTARVQGFTGAIGTGEALQTKSLGLVVDRRNPWASVLLVSLDGQPLADAPKILLFAVARAENTGQVWNGARTALRSPGGPPVLLEGVKAEVTWKPSKPGRYVVAPLDADGWPRAPLPRESRGSAIHFAIGPSDRTAVYLLERGK